MISNGKHLLVAAPIKNMLTTKVREHGVTHGASEAGYDIRIQQEIRFLVDYGGRRTVTIVDGLLSTANPGTFTLASAIEEFQMPNHLVGIVHDKSTWARQGLSVFNTVIEPGWNGFLTLELVYHGNEDLIIPAGSGIAQVIFHDVSDPVQYNGRYQNQANKPVSAIKAE